MKCICFILLVLTANSLFGSTAPTELYPIVVNKKIGFIDSTGMVIVEPIYLAAGKCSEGLIPVRKGGYYGYINTLGEVVIPFKYDYATEFSEGFGIVFIEGRPQYVDRDGEVPFNIDFKEVTKFTNNSAMILTYNDRIGVINKKGTLVIDTIYTAYTINNVSNGIFAIRSSNNDKNLIQYQFIDSNGTPTVLTDEKLIEEYK